MPKKVKKCYGMMDLPILIPCGICRYTKGCFDRTVEDVYVYQCTEDEKESIDRAAWRYVKAQ